MTQPNTKPHTKVHVSVAYHHKTSDIWADLRKRGMLVEVWRLAVERYAAKRNDTLALRPLDRQSIVTDRDAAGADADLITLFKALRYPLRRYPNRWEVTIRNLSKKHGFWSRDRSPITSGSGLHKIEEIREKKEEKREKREDEYKEPETPAPQAASREENQDALNEEIWPQLVSLAASYGGRWSERLGVNQRKIIQARMRDGATPEDLMRAVSGYVRKMHGMDDPLKNFVATTIFRPGAFDANVSSSYLSDPKPPKANGGGYLNERADRAKRGAVELMIKRGISEEDARRALEPQRHNMIGEPK